MGCLWYLRWRYGHRHNQLYRCCGHAHHRFWRMVRTRSIHVGNHTTTRFASAVYRLGAARDTNYIAVGLTTGSMAKSAVIGPRFHMSRFHRVYGLKMIHDLTLDGLIGKQLMGSIKQSVSVRIPLKMGLVLLPGIYTDFNLGMRNDKREPILDVLSGVQVKVAFNGNYKK